MQTLYAMLPCFNEEKDIDPLARRWIALKRQWEDIGFVLKVYCIDDRSTDSTNRVIHSLMKEFPDTVYIIEHEINKGLGGALSTALEFFNTHGNHGDLCVLMDGDNTHDPAYSLSMLESLNQGHDCVIASRYCKTSQIDGVSVFRQFLSWGARAIYTLFLRVAGVKDYTCGYRMYTYELIHRAIQRYGNRLVEYRSFACMMEVLYKLSLLDARFSEVPFELQYSNKEGESKMRVLKTISDSLRAVIKLRFSTRKNMPE